MNPIQRRAFLKTTAATLATSGLTVPVIADQQEDPAGLPTRPLGSTGQRVSIVGLGGYHIGTVEEREAIAIMHEAIDQGMTFFDNAWDYHMGGSEQVMGKALATEGRRDKVFLMTKVCDRDYEGCRKHLDDSLRRLQTDCIDLWQFHEINWDVDPDWIFEKGALKFASGGPPGRQDPLHRFHRTQGLRASFENARQTVRLGYRPDAAERAGPPLPKLPRACAQPNACGGRSGRSA